MADGGVDHIVEALEASFEAAVEREEEVAARDLAFSLLQDARLATTLARGGATSLRLPDGVSARVSILGRDFLGGGDPLDVLVPSGAAVVTRPGPGDGGELRSGALPDIREGETANGPRSGDLSMLEVLREWARAGTKVAASTPSGTYQGRLRYARPDHIVIETSAGEVLVGWGAIRYVRRVLEG